MFKIVSRFLIPLKDLVLTHKVRKLCKSLVGGIFKMIQKVRAKFLVLANLSEGGMKVKIVSV